MPHRDGLLLADLVDVVLRGRVDLLDSLCQNDISVQEGVNPTVSVSL